MLKNKSALTLSILISALAMTACQPKADQKKNTDQAPASVVAPDTTTLRLEGSTEKVPVQLKECHGNSCPEFSIDRLHTNQFVVDDMIDAEILKSLDQMLDIGQLKKDIRVDKDHSRAQNSASQVVQESSAVQASVKTAAEQMAVQIQPYVNAFQALDQELKTLGASSQLKLSISPKILNSDGPLVTVVLNTSSFMGGAHGSSAQSYYNFDLKKQTLLPLDQLIQPGQKAQLEKLAYAAFQKWVMDARLASSISEYEQAWKFHLSNNYYLAKQGLILQYGEYDIGPYVVGLPRFELPYAQLQDILKKEYLPAPAQQDASAVAASKAGS